MNQFQSMGKRDWGLGTGDSGAGFFAYSPQPPAPSPQPLSRGFTLLEVLVALAVLAIALGALVKAGAQQADTLDALRARTFAEWVAADRLARVRLEETWPDTGERRGSTRMGEQDWYWILQISTTDEANIRRLDVKVFNEPGAENSIVTLSGFVGRY